MAPGNCHRVDLVTSVKESCIIFILSSSHFGKKEEHAIIIVKVDFYHIFITFKSRFKCGLLNKRMIIQIFLILQHRYIKYMEVFTI